MDDVKHLSIDDTRSCVEYGVVLVPYCLFIGCVDFVDFHMVVHTFKVYSICTEAFTVNKVF